MDRLFWRLYYADDSSMDEPNGNLSIRDARAGAVALVVTKATDETPANRAPLVKVDLNIGDKPIFYRKRSMGEHGEDYRLDATVFGRAREGDDRILAKLWMYDGLDRLLVSGLPPWAEDSNMVKLQLKHS